MLFPVVNSLFFLSTTWDGYSLVRPSCFLGSLYTSMDVCLMISSYWRALLDTIERGIYSAIEWKGSIFEENNKFMSARLFGVSSRVIIGDDDNLKQ